MAQHLREVALVHKKIKGCMPNLIIVVIPDFGSEDIYLRIKKINAKLGGINFLLKPDTIPFLTDTAVPTIVMGADVMHPGPCQSGRPSYAAVVGCVDTGNSKYIGVTRAQGCRVEMIEELADMVARHHIRYDLNDLMRERSINPAHDLDSFHQQMPFPTRVVTFPPDWSLIALSPVQVQINLNIPFMSLIASPL
ncbi:hypothetical protein FRC00_002794 [Tulasnella sp. 408]|nr:hypothetical protein FRC00_002794 [Tulasnella sp. 408]